MKGLREGNSCLRNPNSCSAAGPKKSVGFPLSLQGPWYKVDLPFRSVGARWDGRLTDSGQGNQSTQEVAFAPPILAELKCVLRIEGL